jgi:hypothetical protein
MGNNAVMPVTFITFSFFRRYAISLDIFSGLLFYKDFLLFTCLKDALFDTAKILVLHL